MFLKHKTCWGHEQPFATITRNGCQLLPWQVQAADAEKGEEQVTAEMLLLAPLVLSPKWNPCSPFVKALYLRLQAFVDFHRAKGICSGRCVCINCILYKFALGSHECTCMPCLATASFCCGTAGKTKITKSNSFGSGELIRSNLCPGRHRESWSPSGCWFQSCSRGQWPASSASAGKIDLGEKQMAHRVNFTDKPCYSSVFVEKYQRSWSACGNLFENNKQFEMNRRGGIDPSDLFTNASHWSWPA